MRWLGFALVGVVAGAWLAAGGRAPTREAHRPQSDWQVDFRWRGQVEPGQWIWIRNMNGEIHVRRADGPEVEVVAEKKWRRSDPESVEIVAVPHDGTVTICALWEARRRRCEPRGNYGHSRTSRSDVNVRFTISLPDGVKLDASTTNGELTVTEVAAPVVARTTNGDVTVTSSQGPIEASTTNGSIDAHAGVGVVKARTTNGDIKVRMDSLADLADLSYTTTNGSITAVLPPGVNAEIDASLTNGRIHTDFPLRVQGRLSPRHLRATLGDGGPLIRLRTTNGSIHLQEGGEATGR